MPKAVTKPLNFLLRLLLAPWPRLQPGFSKLLASTLVTLGALADRPQLAMDKAANGKQTHGSCYLTNFT